MRKLTLLLAVALIACTLPACEEETTLPYDPVENPGNDTPTVEDPEPQTVTYRIAEVRQYSPDNAMGVDITGKFDFFATPRMTIVTSPSKMTFAFDNGEVPFLPFAAELPEGEIECELDTSVSPNVLRIKDTETVLATFDASGFGMSFQLDCKQLNYSYKFKSIE